MVLQRDAPILVSGNGPEGTRIKITFGKQDSTTSVTADGTWKAELPAMTAGGPLTLEVSDGTATTRVDDIAIGDVWVCSGQSNMQMGLDEAIGGADAIKKAASDKNLRLLTIPKAAADQPQVDPGAKWKPATPENLKKFSAVAAFFALHLRDDPALAKVPLGIIDTSYGGTAIEAWTPKGTLPDIPENEISGSMFGIPPGNLYNRMIAPLTANKIKGAIWYQGEANAAHPGVYSSLLGNMASQWRKAWEQEQLPFFIVQLPAFEGLMDGLDFGWLREAQAKACRDTPWMHLAVTYDTTNGSDLHPAEKEEIGRRLSLLARKEAYGGKLIARGPVVAVVKEQGHRLMLSFDQPVKAADGGKITGFAIAGTDGDYRFADATAQGNKVLLETDSVAEPKTIRYAFGGLPNANLVNGTGLPAIPFRTDTQEPRSLAFQPLPVVYRLSGKSYQIETGDLGNIASLVAGGKQFLSAEPGGGTRIPAGFGPRNLPNFRALAPDRIEFSDRELKFEVACKDNSMEWTLANTGKDPVELHVSLAPQVQVKGTAPSIQLTRNETRISLAGIDRVENSRIVFKVEGKTTGILKWNMIGK